MAVVVVVGAQWGDEGKGKVVDLLTKEASLVARYGGGANAGHTLVVGGEKIILRLVPSGALHKTTTCVLGSGVVIDPAVLVDEIATLRARGLEPDGRIVISDRAHLVMPQHMLVDALRESGPDAIGTTKRGIGPTYEDKVARRGVRMGDLLRPAEFEAALQRNLEAWRPTIAALGSDVPDAAEIAARYLALGQQLAPFVGDASEAVHAARVRGENILLEGAQGTMLDIDHGTFPFVTSSTVIAGGACGGLGLGPTAIDRVIGVTKAYTTRVGGGPFPTELHGPEGDALRDAGGEYGSVTGRPRRCGWLDLPVLRHAVRVNGIEDLALTKLDVLSGMKTLRLCVAYEVDGKRVDVPPSRDLGSAKAIYEELPGWSEDVSGMRKLEELPQALRAYVRRIEELAGAKVSLISIGPDRAQTIELAKPYR